MTFTLKKVIDGESRDFTLQNILEILGDPTNDEIDFEGEAFRISSFGSSVVSGGGGGAGSGSSSGTIFTWQDYLLTVTVVGQTEIELETEIPEGANLLLTVNGVYYESHPQLSYHIIGSTLFWHGSFELEPSDTVRLRYQITQ